MTAAWPPVRRPGCRRCARRRDKAGAVQPEPFRLVGDAGQRDLQVLVDVGGQGPERRDVDDPGSGRLFGGSGAVGLGPVGGIDGHQEAGQRLAGAGGRGDQHVPTGRRCAARPGAGARSVPPGSAAGTSWPPPDGKWWRRRQRSRRWRRPPTRVAPLHSTRPVSWTVRPGMGPAEAPDRRSVPVQPEPAVCSAIHRR